MTHGFEREALEEYQDAADWYEHQRDRLGEEFVAAVEQAIAEIAKAPARFPPAGDGLRVFRMKRFPYQLIYRHAPERDHATVFALLHHRRRPGYWLHRLSRDSK